MRRIRPGYIETAIGWLHDRYCPCMAEPDCACPDAPAGHYWDCPVGRAAAPTARERAEDQEATG